MGPFVAADALAFARKNWMWIVGALLIVAVLTLTYCAGGAGEREDQLQEQIETQKKVGKADTKAGETRVEDAVRTEQQKEELSDAVENATSPDDLRRRRGCAILRQQGRPLPATCG